MKRHLYILGLALFFQPFLFGQQRASLEITLLDEESKEEIWEASIELTPLNSSRGESSSTLSGNNGRFSANLSADESYVIRIIAPDYAPIADTIKITAHLSKKYTLRKQSDRSLKEVIVRSNKRIASTDLSTHKIEVERIRKLPAIVGEIDILRVLQFLPGISNSGDNSVGFNVRGGKDDQNLILLDEAPIFNPTHLFGLFSSFNSNAIKDFTLYKGGIPAKFGGRLSSVLDVDGNDGNNKSYRGNISLGILSANLSIQGPIYKKKGQDSANTSFFVAGRRSFIDLFTPEKSPDDGSPLLKVYFYDINAKVAWQAGKRNKLSLSGYFGRDFFSFPGTFSFGWGNITSTLRWDHTYGKRLSSSISAIYSNYNFAYSFYNTGWEFSWKGQLENVFLKANWEYALSPISKLFFGVNGNYILGRPGAIVPSLDNSPVTPIRIQNEQGFENAIFGEINHKLSAKWRVRAGLRFEWFGRFGNDSFQQYANDNPVTFNPDFQTYERAPSIGKKQHDGELFFNFFALSPRLNVTYVLSEGSSIKASYNKMFQYVQNLSTGSTSTPFSVYRLSSPYIHPAEADQFSLGYFMNIPFKKHLVEASVETFYKRFHHQLDYIDGAQIGLNNTIETELLKADAYAYGVELFIDKSWGRLTGMFSYTFSSSIYQPMDNGAGGKGINNGNDYSSPYNLPHNLSVVVSYDISKRISVSAAFVYRTGRPVTYPEGRYGYNDYIIPIYGERNKNRMGDYHRLDLSVVIDGKFHPNSHTHSQWIISIFNVYNRQNPFSIAFGEKSSNVPGGPAQTQAQQLSIFGIIPGFSYRLEIK